MKLFILKVEGRRKVRKHNHVSRRSANADREWLSPAKGTSVSLYHSVHRDFWSTP